MSWKQPTPTDINGFDNLTFLERAMFREIIAYCRNESGLEQFTHAGKHYAVELKRGQCIIKVAKIAGDLKIDHKRVRRSIEIISKWYTELESKAMPFGLIVTVKDYNTLVRMESKVESQRKVKGKSKESERRPNKSVKSVKNVKNVNTNAMKVLEIYNRLYERELTSTRGFENNLTYWLEEYSLEDIEAAFEGGLKDNYWRNILTPVILFRRKNQHGEEVDWIADLKGRGRSRKKQRKLRSDEAYGPDGKIRRIGGDN